MAILLNKQNALFWGKFIEVAVSMEAIGGTNPAQPGNFPKGWKLVKNINAIVAIGGFHQKEFIGFVAQSIKEPKKFAVVFHGSQGFLDIINDLQFQLIDFKFIPGGGKTEYGFTTYYESMSFVDPDSGQSQSLKNYLRRLPHDISFIVAGHSLGAALATLHSAVLAYRNVPVEAFLFGSPMVGNAAFVKTYNSLVSKSYRIVNKPDIVPYLPGPKLGYSSVKTRFTIDSRNNPQIKQNIYCYHLLSTYLYTLGATDTDLGSCRV